MEEDTLENTQKTVKQNVQSIQGRKLYNEIALWCLEFQMNWFKLTLKVVLNLVQVYVLQLK